MQFRLYHLVVASGFGAILVLTAMRLAAVPNASAQPGPKAAAIRYAPSVSSPGDHAAASAVLAQILDRVNGASVKDMGMLDMGKYEGRPMYRVDIEIPTGALWGSAQDFNGLAGKAMPIAVSAFARIPQLERLRFIAREKGGVDWAYVELRRSELSAGWAESSYLLQWHEANVLVPQMYARPWLCAFERTYTSAANPVRHEVECSG